MAGRSGRAVWFTGPRHIELRETDVRSAGPTEITVRATRSLISAGTEMLVYRGDTTPGDRMPPNSEGTLPFPTKYGYQIVGEVVDAGAESGYAVGDRVFCRHPHQDLFTIDARPAYVVRVPDGVGDAAATFLNLTRVALTGVLDVPVKPGETAVVFGQGIVGMMCARIANLGAAATIVVDRFEKRRELALRYGMAAAVEPQDVASVVAELSHGRGADIVYEASGAPPALQSAIEIAADRGEIVAISLYGSHLVPLRLAPEFHFRRLRITSSQMTDQPRWDWARRTEASFELLRRLPVDDMVSRTVGFDDAADAYDMVDRDPANVLGVVLDYARG
ncbi:zinc-binding alcohol dehydrogenase [Pseudolysinimonas kribbensis]|uniref:Alcohol dehydrogenase n=1 Tax=Pseudolysinimonas kribbensis TaxID=433641 RepID=A0ABQ6KC37_9MICO|nr:zinc-binding alcohol dehydrogenase [Pseudolysinimonas kribbensis]GMA96197.1 alcohol dehydrogenase [Pseudolysinimonas kribbensis]